MCVCVCVDACACAVRASVLCVSVLAHTVLCLFAAGTRAVLLLLDVDVCSRCDLLFACCWCLLATCYWCSRCLIDAGARSRCNYLIVSGASCSRCVCCWCLLALSVLCLLTAGAREVLLLVSIYIDFN